MAATPGLIGKFVIQWAGTMHVFISALLCRCAASWLQHQSSSLVSCQVSPFLGTMIDQLGRQAHNLQQAGCRLEHARVIAASWLSTGIRQRQLGQQRIKVIRRTRHLLSYGAADLLLRLRKRRTHEPAVSISACMGCSYKVLALVSLHIQGCCCCCCMWSLKSCNCCIDLVQPQHDIPKNAFVIIAARQSNQSAA